MFIFTFLHRVFFLGGGHTVLKRFFFTLGSQGSLFCTRFFKEFFCTLFWREFFFFVLFFFFYMVLYHIRIIFKQIYLCCILMKISIIKIRADSLSFRIRTGLFLSAFSSWWHEERDKILKSLTILCWPPTHIHARAVHLVVFKISASRDSKRSIATFNGRPPLTVFLKSSNSPDHFFWA